jgi:hypothetical protein
MPSNLFLTDDLSFSLARRGLGTLMTPRPVWMMVFFLTLSTGKSFSETRTTTLRQQTRDLLKQEAVAPTGHRKDDALAALCDLYVVLRQDDRYSNSEMLQQDAAKIRRRLLTIAARREARLKREDTPRPTSMSRHVDSAISKALAAEPAERGNLGELAFQGAQAAGAFDNGWQLVELIQRIVEPSFWDTQGGPGTVRYFAIRRVLVVRATSDVHQQIRELLLKLPR